ncbi:GerAB/ArcD/ProY family transporter [Paenibacillus montanisoli]|uniref:Spore gernimation protein n=1 Tax=Paenibacillus montanisoli TaxID=2081970 RepID=A0A328U6P7_9BACL|nr:endospore germination permease [Paenibacillus montanisoli]RAP77762.1 spore gernimation protein [Paenibacillus montanisoli]
MKKYALNDITLIQYIMMIHGSQLGFGLLALPADLANYAGMDGWISLIIGWLLAVIASLFIVQLMKKHPDDTVYDLLPRYFGKPLGAILNCCFILYFLFGFFITFIASIGFFKIEFLPNTPNFLMVLLFILPTYNLVRNNVRVLSRYAEITFWGFLWIFIVFMYPLKEAHWLNLLPVLRDGWQPVFQAVNTTCLSFLGFEIGLILHPFLKHKEHAVKGIVIGNLLTLIIYLGVILICFLFFSPDDITSYRFPTLKVLKIIEFRFMERIEIIVLVGYAFLIIRVWTHYLFAGAFGISRLLGKQDHKRYAAITLAIVLILSTYYKPSNIGLRSMLKIFGKLGWGFAFALPIILLVYTKVFAIFRKGAYR